MSTLPTPKLAVICTPGDAESPFTLHSNPPPETIAEFLVGCLHEYEREYRGWLMIIRFEPKDLTIGDDIPVNMHLIAVDANNRFAKQIHTPQNPRRNTDGFPTVKVKNEFTIKDGERTDFRSVFIIQTKYRYEPDYNNTDSDGRCSDGTYFVPTHHDIH
jgi:hypothetical protein